MARLNIEDEFWGDIRLEILTRKIGRERAVVSVLDLWRIGQKYWAKEHSLIPNDIFTLGEFPEELFECQFAERRPEGIYVKGAEKQFEWLYKRRQSAKAGGISSGKSRRNKIDNLTEANPNQTLTKTKQTQSKTNPPTLTLSPTLTLTQNTNTNTNTLRASLSTHSREVWEIFENAYQDRYGVPPVRNARVNSQIKQFIGRVGEEAAKGVAKFYLEHNDAWYVKNAHSVGMLLRDAEKLHTEWKTGNKLTNAYAKSEESKSSYFEQMQRLGIKE